MSPYNHSYCTNPISPTRCGGTRSPQVTPGRHRSLLQGSIAQGQAEVAQGTAQKAHDLHLPAGDLRQQPRCHDQRGNHQHPSALRNGGQDGFAKKHITVVSSSSKGFRTTETQWKTVVKHAKLRLEAKLKGFLSFCLVEVILEASTNHQSNDIGVMSWKNS